MCYLFFRYKPSLVKLIRIYRRIPLNKLISDILHIRASADTDCLIHEPGRREPSGRKPPLNFLWLYANSTAKTATSVKLHQWRQLSKMFSSFIGLSHNAICIKYLITPVFWVHHSFWLLDLRISLSPLIGLISICQDIFDFFPRLTKKVKWH